MRYCPIIKDECSKDCVFGAVDKNNKPVCMLSEVLWAAFLMQTGARLAEKTLWDSNDDVSM